MTLPLLLSLLLFAPEELPKAEAILARYVEVTGGRAAYAQVHSSLSKGTMSLTAQNLKGSMMVYEADPGKQVTVVEFPGIGRLEEGTDGVRAWSNSALEGARLKDGEEKAAALRAANSEGKFLDWKKLYKSIETTGIEDVDGRPCYKVMMIPLVGKAETDYYDKASGFLVKETATISMPMGEVPVSIALGGYRKEGGVLLPHSLQQTVAGQRVDISIDSVVANPEFPANRFDPPAEVRALIK